MQKKKKKKCNKSLLSLTKEIAKRQASKTENIQTMITLFLPQENKERTKLWPILTQDSKGQVATPKFHSGKAVGDHLNLYAAAAKLLQSCPTLWDPIYGSPPGSPIPEILQARTQEWAAISFSNAWKWKVKEFAQLCPTLSDPMNCGPPGSSIHAIFQARVLEWGATAFS